MQPQTQEPQSVAQNALPDQPKTKVADGQIAAVAAKPQDPVAKAASEEAPPIKTEENQANWKAFRERRDQERKEREAAQKQAQEERARAEALKAALEAVTGQPQRQAQQYEAQEESEDDRIQKKIDAAVEARLAKERARYEQEERERESKEAPERILQAFPDFKQVVSTENCDYLDYHYPELTAPFKYMPEGYEKWAAMYRAVKKFVPNPDSRKEQNRAERNLQKPGSLSTPGATTGGNAMPSARLDDAKKADNWARMQRTLKGLS